MSGGSSSSLSGGGNYTKSLPARTTTTATEATTTVTATTTTTTEAEATATATTATAIPTAHLHPPGDISEYIINGHDPKCNPTMCCVVRRCAVLWRRLGSWCV